MENWKTSCNHSRHNHNLGEPPKVLETCASLPSEASSPLLPTHVVTPLTHWFLVSSSSITHAYLIVLTSTALSKNQDVPRNRIRICSLITIQHRAFLQGESPQNLSSPRMLGFGTASPVANNQSDSKVSGMYSGAHFSG